MKALVLVMVALVTTGCSVAHVDSTPEAQYDQPASIEGSLFASDQAVLSDAAVTKALDGVVSVPADARVALLDLSPEQQSVRYYGWAYWRSEQYMNQQQRYFHALAVPLVEKKGVKAVVPMPSFTINKKMSLPQIREAAVRMQIDTLVIYALRSDIFERTRFFAPTEVKGYATCEVAIFDTRTGVMPYTDIVTEKVMTTRAPGQENMYETRMRAEIMASEKCLSAISSGVAAYMDGG